MQDLRVLHILNGIKDELKVMKIQLNALSGGANVGGTIFNEINVRADDGTVQRVVVRFDQGKYTLDILQ